MGTLLPRDLSRLLTQKMKAQKAPTQTAVLPRRYHAGQIRSPLNLLDRRVTMGLRFEVHLFTSQPDYELWTRMLMGCNANVSSPDCQSTLNGLPEAERVFISFFLALAKLLLQQGRIPVFDDITVNAVETRDLTKRDFFLDLSVEQVDFVPATVYELAIKEAYKFCCWMARHAPTPENREWLFTTMDQDVVKELLKRVPGGKSTIPVLRVAHTLGVPFMHLGEGVYQLGWGSKARRIDRSSTDGDGAFAGKLSHNKAAAANLLRLAGLPAPSHSVVGTLPKALAAIAHLGYPVVVKPIDLNRGEGVTVDVAEAGALQTAFHHAQQLGKSKLVLIEQQVPGVCHRFFVANGRLLYAVKRWPMSVRGDGRRTVAQLVAAELLAQQFKPIWARNELQAVDDRAVRALAQAGCTPESIPEMGVLAPLRRIESTADGGVDEDVTTTAHPDNVAIALAASRLFALNVAGVDIISPDITEPWYENGAIINEVNFAPLLGGAEISRSYIPAFLSEYLGGDGKIPIETFVCEDAALAQQAVYRQNGLRCFFASQTTITDGSGKQDP